jgi:hypothetical protein
VIVDIMFVIGGWNMKSLAAALVLVVLAHQAHAQAFEVTWYTLDGGGGTSAGGIYSLSGTIGQPDAGAALLGGVYSITGGYWTGVVAGDSCPADFNHDGSVDFFDYDDFVVCFEDPNCPGGDFNRDGSVDFFDYDDFVVAFETGC